MCAPPPHLPSFSGSATGVNWLSPRLSGHRHESGSRVVYWLRIGAPLACGNSGHFVATMCSAFLEFRALRSCVNCRNLKETVVRDLCRYIVTLCYRHGLHTQYTVSM